MSEQPAFVPLMHEEEAAYLKSLVLNLSEDGCILEYGCGGSTLMFQQLLRPDQWLFSVEHNKEWYDRIEPLLTRNVTMYRIDLGVEKFPYAIPEEEGPANCHGYICPPDIPWERIELVFVDGIARGACLATVLSVCRPGTKVVLHDYVRREWWYDWAVKLYPQGYIVNTMMSLTVPADKHRPVPQHKYVNDDNA